MYMYFEKYKDNDIKHTLLTYIALNLLFLIFYLKCVFLNVEFKYDHGVLFW